ncbi:uncharacterized protein LOC101850700 [Aplysia californica]|uniref:Uncharacterized protein LOC101850700 n=1 Tax=Aplysia californica TaxID=6500 RepID=A0ABM0JFJ1_APLCA|nr:uncharacterized protein LOC101850700 [Aplysia californica]
MSKKKLETYLDRDVGRYNKELLKMARQMQNKSPPLPSAVRLADEIQATLDKEHLGDIFNRSVKESMKSRWKVVEEGEANFLEDVVGMNSQLVDKARKDEQQFIQIIQTRAANLKLASKSEEMAGLCMHLECYRAQLEKREEFYRPLSLFMKQCADIMGFHRSETIVDRHITLCCIRQELLKDFEEKATVLNALHDRLQKIQGDERRQQMLFNIKIGTLQDTLKEKHNEVLRLENELNDMLNAATNTSIALFRARNGVYHLYENIMNYRGLEKTDTSTHSQLATIERQIMHTVEVLQDMNKEQMLQATEKKDKKGRNGEGEERKDSKVSSDSNDQTSLSIHTPKKAQKHPPEHTRSAGPKSRKDKLQKSMTAENKSQNRRFCYHQNKSLSDTVPVSGMTNSSKLPGSRLKSIGMPSAGTLGRDSKQFHNSQWAEDDDDDDDDNDNVEYRNNKQTCMNGIANCDIERETGRQRRRDNWTGPCKYGDKTSSDNRRGLCSFDSRNVPLTSSMQEYDRLPHIGASLPITSLPASQSAHALERQPSFSSIRAHVAMIRNLGLEEQQKQFLPRLV